MELLKLKQEKVAFEQRLRDVIQAEIDSFMKAGGISPSAIYVNIVRVDRIGAHEPDFIFRGVEVEFGL